MPAKEPESKSLINARCMALQFLINCGSHTMPKTINTENEFAAAMLFVEMMEDGLVLCTVGNKENGPTYTITEAGRQYMKNKYIPDNDI